MAKTKIMAVDDEPDIISLLDRILKRAGYDFVGSTTGRDFLKKYVKEKPELVLLDIMMPEMDGWEVYKEIRKINKDQKVSILTALDVPARVKKGVLDLGARDYITKPFDPDELLEKIRTILSK